MANICIPDGLLQLSVELGAPILLADLADCGHPGLYVTSEVLDPDAALIVVDRPIDADA